MTFLLPIKEYNNVKKGAFNSLDLKALFILSDHIGAISEIIT